MTPRCYIPLLVLAALLLAAPAALAQPRPDRDARPHFDPRQRDRDRAPQSLTDEQVDQLIAVIEDINPHMHQRVLEALERNPDTARRRLAMVYPKMARLIELRETDPDAYRDTVKERRLTIANTLLAQQARKAQREDDDRRAQQLTNRLRSNLSQQFDLQHENRKRRLAEMQDRLDTLTEELEDHASRKEEIIDEQVDRLLSGQRPARFEDEPRFRPPRPRDEDRPRLRPRDHDSPRPTPPHDRNTDTNATPATITPRHD